MSHPRVAVVGGVILIVVVVAAGFGIFQPKKEQEQVQRLPIPASLPRPSSIESKSAVPPPVPAAEVLPVPAAPPALSPEALNARMLGRVDRGRIEIPLRMAERRAGLQLTEEQHERLLNAMLDFDHVRAQLEKALVTVKFFDGSTLVLQIPAYPEKGAALKAAFVNRVNDDFPSAVAEAIERAVDGPMHSLLGGFGRFSREDTVKLTNSGDVHIKFNAGISGNVDAADSATLEAVLRLSGDSAVDRDALPIFHEAISEVIEAHFPAK